MSLILSGTLPREEILKKLKKKITKLGLNPRLAIIQVGNNEASNAYIRQKMLYAEKIGAGVELFHLDKKVKTKEVVKLIKKCNQNKKIHGIIVQLPIPKHLNLFEIIETIDPKKDVDGLTAENVKLLWQGSEEGFFPATAKGILLLLQYYKIPVKSQKVVVVGRSMLVGKPVSAIFLHKNATVTLCHSKTKNLSNITQSADIVISAIGRARFLTRDFFKKGQVVVDVGITKVKGKLVGDVDFENVKDIVGAISPVPGGVGLMTVSALFENLVEAHERQRKSEL